LQANNFRQERGLPLQQPPIGESNDEVVAWCFDDVRVAAGDAGMERG
jgi:hypothetical protein